MLPTTPECAHRTSLSSITFSRVYIHTSLYVYLQVPLAAVVWERSVWRWHRHRHRHWHCSVRSTNWCCEAAPPPLPGPPFFTSSVNPTSIRSVSTQEELLPKKKRETRIIRPCHRLGSPGSSEMETSMTEVYWRGLWDRDSWGYEGSQAWAKAEAGAAMPSQQRAWLIPLEFWS